MTARRHLRTMKIGLPIRTGAASTAAVDPSLRWDDNHRQITSSKLSRLAYGFPRASVSIRRWFFATISYP